MKISLPRFAPQDSVWVIYKGRATRVTIVTVEATWSYIEASPLKDGTSNWSKPRRSTQFIYTAKPDGTACRWTDREVFATKDDLIESL